MFGLLKENILNKLEDIYSKEGEETFKNEFAKFMITIKESKDLKEFYNMYSAINEAEFNNFSLAKDFIDESLIYLNNLNKSEINKLKSLYSLPQSEKKIHESINNCLDELIFNENLSIKDKYHFKTKLISSILKENIDERKNYIKVINDTDQKITENIKNLSEDQLAVVDLFIENDEDKIKDYYSRLISETQEKIDNKIVDSKDKNELIINLIEAKRKLKNMLNEASISNIETVLLLKSEF